MKPATVFLGEMTSPEVEAFLATHHTVIIPTGATEQHGPHAPLLTDVLIPQEVARRAAPALNALVAPPINYALSYPHVGFKGLVHISIPTFMSMIEDLSLAFANAGFKRIVFLNGHYDNTYAIAYACANAAYKLPKDVRAFPVNYWDGMPPEVMAQYSSLEKGMHAHAAETAAILALNPTSST
jgi:creatinine amidohydrolase